MSRAQMLAPVDTKASVRQSIMVILQVLYSVAVMISIRKTPSLYENKKNPQTLNYLEKARRRREETN